MGGAEDDGVVTEGLPGAKWSTRGGGREGEKALPVGRRIFVAPATRVGSVALLQTARPPASDARFPCHSPAFGDPLGVTGTGHVPAGPDGRSG